MNFKDAVVHCFQNYATFSGRAARSEYWYFVLFMIIGSIALGVIDGIIFSGNSILGGLFSLGMLIPSIAVGVRRLHDMDKSGWWLLVALIPILGGLYLLFLFVQKGSDGANQFGADPVAGVAVKRAA